MRGREFPTDIWEAADEAMQALDAAGLLHDDADEQQAVKRIIAMTLNADRERIQADVIAAVANETDECKAAVFKALRTVTRQ